MKNKNLQKMALPNKNLAKGLCLYMEKMLQASGVTTALQKKLGEIQSSPELNLFCIKHEDLACELIGNLLEKDHDIVCSKLALALFDLLKEEGFFKEAI